MKVVIDIVMNETEAILSFVCAPLFFVVGKIVLKILQYRMRKGV
jgi:hypothetical protein